MTGDITPAEQLVQQTQAAVDAARVRRRGSTRRNRPEGGELHVSRPQNDGGGALKVIVDNQEVGKLESGERLAVPLGEGPHGIRFKYLYISSELVVFYIGDGATVEVVAKPAFGSGPFDVRYFTKRETAIAVEVREP